MAVGSSPFVAAACGPSSLRRACVLLALVPAVLGNIGCVQRRLMIVSKPPGALVYVGNQEVGTTPVAVNFTYYGTRQVRLVKDGFETLVDQLYVPAPWYQIPPLDFVAETLNPVTVTDRRTVEYTLLPQAIPSVESILERGNDLRGSTRGGLPPPAPPAVTRRIIEPE